SIRAARRMTLHRFLVALGIPGVGETAARRLADRFETLDAIRHASREALVKAPGVGSALAGAIHEFFAEPRHQRTIDALLARGVEVVAEKARRHGALAGRTFVFTGKLERFTRSEAESLVESLGARATDSVGRGTDYVVVGENPGSKAVAAREKG